MRLALFGILIGICALLIWANHALESEVIPYMTETTPIEGTLDVGWREWSDEVFQEAKQNDRLILLDLTAVWCHWCHVMDTTTYSDPDVVGLIKRHYVPIRVDTDRRPDIAARYISGGWPTTAFLTPDGMVLLGETYVPPERMKQLLVRVHTYYNEKKDEIRQTINRQQEAGAHGGAPSLKPSDAPSEKIFEKAAKLIADSFDEVHGGFGSEPKFPSYEVLRFLFLPYTERRDERLKKFLTLTLDSMQGIYDPVWGGFYRYSVNKTWTEAHYEKMSAENAEAAALYLTAHQAFSKEEYLKVAEGILQYVQQFLTDADGGFYASQDADVMKDGKLIAGEEYFRLNRSERLRKGIPYIDRSIYADINGKMISAFLAAYAVTGNERYQEIAEKALGRFINDGFSQEAGFLHRIPQTAGGLSLCSDQAAMIRALLDGYESTGKDEYLQLAERAVEIMDKNFGAPDGGYYDITESAEAAGLLKRRIKPLPENTSMAVNLIRLYFYTGKEEYKNLARATLAVFKDDWENYSIFSALYAGAVYWYRNFPLEIAIVGKKSDGGTHSLLKEALHFFEPRKVILILDPKEDADRLAQLPYVVRPQPVMYSCVETACSMPISEAQNVVPNLTRFVKKYLYFEKQ
ncbi:MAG: DUF255 domain-containing protein [bacterium]